MSARPSLSASHTSPANHRNPIILGLLAALLLVIAANLTLCTPSHGFFAEEPSINLTSAEGDSAVESEGSIDQPLPVLDLAHEKVSLTFVPAKPLFRGIEIAFRDVSPNTSGVVTVSASDDSGLVAETVIDARNIVNDIWYKIPLDGTFAVNRPYLLTIDATTCSAPITVLGSFEEAASQEASNSPIVLVLAYAKPVFTPSETALICLLLLALWLAVFWLLHREKTGTRKVLETAVFIALATLLTWTYLFCSMDNANDTFDEFQVSSESLVLTAIGDSEHGEPQPDLQGYGLGSHDGEYGFGKPDENGVAPYLSQYGLQGKTFKALSSFLDLEAMHFVTALALALVLTGIVFLLRKKYNSLLAVVFYATFLLSPWIVNFARNLYWVEFTWFLPMLIGLICSLNLRHRTIRRICYLLAGVAIFVKCLCGYEYISTIMIGSVAFLLADLVQALATHNKSLARIAILAVLGIGTACLIGFVTALCIHADLRGGGSLLAGLHDIYQQDVLRRTAGANLNALPEVYWESLNASTWETLNQYFRFKSQLIVGIDGNLFPLLALGSTALFAYQIYHKTLIPSQIALFVVFLAAAASWFVLAMGHSYIHTHMNYVLWYFGFVQMCLYVPLSAFVSFIRPQSKQP